MGIRRRIYFSGIRAAHIGRARTAGLRGEKGAKVFYIAYVIRLSHECWPLTMKIVGTTARGRARIHVVSRAHRPVFPRDSATKLWPADRLPGLTSDSPLEKAPGILPLPLPPPENIVSPFVTRVASRLMRASCRDSDALAINPSETSFFSARNFISERGGEASRRDVWPDVRISIISGEKKTHLYSAKISKELMFLFILSHFSWKFHEFSICDMMGHSDARRCLVRQQYIPVFLPQIHPDKGAFSRIQPIGNGERGGFGQHAESCHAQGQHRAGCVT